MGGGGRSWLRRELLQGLPPALGLGALGLDCSRPTDQGNATVTSAASAGPPTAALSAAPARSSATLGTATPQSQPPRRFRSLDVAGTHRQIGRAMGEAFRGEILAVLHGEPSFKQVVAAAQGPAKELVMRFRQATGDIFPDLLDELRGLAEGCQVPLDDLFSWICRSEIQAAGLEDQCERGCSTVGLVHGGRMILAHNEDGADVYLGRMFVLRARPPSGISFAALVYPGTLAGNGPGLNARGIVQTTNFIASCEVSEGLPRYFIGRAVLEARDLPHAIELATTAERAFPWHHNLASLPDARLVSLETWPGKHHSRDVEGLLLHTNHLLHEEMKDLPEQKSYHERSSLPRLTALQKRLGEVPLSDVDRDLLIAALTDRSGSPCKVCRRPGDEVPGVTVGSAVFASPDISMDLLAGAVCSGPADRVVP